VLFEEVQKVASVSKANFDGNGSNVAMLNEATGLGEPDS
jgi:hypothetical protein